MNDRSLLIVDDETELLASLDQYLSRVGFDVLSASGGAEALAMAVTSPPDMVVSDINMDEMDGFELQRRIQDLYGHSVPFLFLTARGDLQDRLRGLRNGADDYVIKPFDPEELEARITTILERVDVVKEGTTKELLQKEGRLLERVAHELEVPADFLVQELDSVECSGTCCPELQDARVSAKRLQQQIKELPWSIAETSPSIQIHTRPARVAPVIRGAAANAARTASEKQIRLKLSCGGLLSANLDADAMRKAISNILERAVREAPEQSTVQLHAHRAKDGGIEIQISISAQQTPGSKAPPPIGVAQSILSAHGGRIELVNSEETTTFVLWIPDNVGVAGA